MLLSERVLKIAKAEGISEAELRSMLHRAAPFTSSDGNRRFHDWLFTVDKSSNLCQTMCRVELKALNPAGPRGHIEEEHDDCDGEGCKSCGWVGRVVRYF